MSLNVKELNLDGKNVSLRLSTKAICNYVMKHGQEDAPPIASVMLAIDSLQAKCDLLTGALHYPDNHNAVRTGEDLLDLLADAGYTPDKVNELIIELAKQAGLCGEEDLMRLQDASHANTAGTVDKLVGLLNGTLDVSAGASAEAPEEDKSPT